MDHLLKEELDLIKDQNEEIIESLALIRDKLGIPSGDYADDEDINEDEDEEKDKLDF